MTDPARGDGSATGYCRVTEGRHPGPFRQARVTGRSNPCQLDRSSVAQTQLSAAQVGGRREIFRRTWISRSSATRENSGRVLHRYLSLSSGSAFGG